MDFEASKESTLYVTEQIGQNVQEAAMDRRQRKTREAIFSAFRELLRTKRYDHITVGEIIEKADVGRSTFYAHFETKDLLLNAVCQDIFYHIFQKDSCPWIGRDDELEARLAHILWHIQEDKQNVAGILTSDSSELFMGYFKKHLETVFEEYIGQFHMNVPKDFFLNHLVGGFSQTLIWWMNEGMKTPPQTVAAYYLRMVERH